MTRNIARGIQVFLALLLVIFVCGFIGMAGGPKIAFGLFLVVIVGGAVSALLHWSSHHAKWGE